MDNYISREAVYSIFKQSCDECKDFCLEFDGIEPDCESCMMGKAKRQMLDIPVADVRPVVKARWEGETGYIFSEHTERLYCPVCGSFSYFGTLTRRSFCPNCGADMREAPK